jgi:predicted metal-dependent peptidase
MNEPNFDKMKDSVTLEEVKAALRLVCVSLPHLSGLAQLVRIHIDSRVSTMCIFQSGRLVVNPDWFKTLNRAEATFVMAHELLHLALKTHERTIESDPQLFNWAHDYIINDMLVESLGGPVPAGGLEWEGARQMSAESLIQQLGGRRLSGKKVLKISRGKKKNSVLKTTMAAALHGTGLLSDEENQNLEDEDVLREWYDDVLSIELEREWFPNTDPRELESACRQIRETAAKSVSLGLLKEEVIDKHGFWKEINPVVTRE